MQASGFRQFWHDLCLWWREQAREHGAADAGLLLLRNLWGFVRDSTPERRRARYGDMEYDWTHRVNTTSGTVGWRLRLLGLFHSPYQPTEPAVRFIDDAPLSDEERALVCHRNAERVFRIAPLE